MTVIPEIANVNTGHTFQYSLMGEKWTGSLPVITWSFAESTVYDQSLRQSYIDYPLFEEVFDQNQKQLIRSAFQLWEDAGNIDFVEQADTVSSKIRIGWDSIDGHIRNGGILGQATIWTEGSAITCSALQLDLADKPDAYWGQDSPPDNSWSFLATVAHEVGHALGLDHSSSSAALMYAYAGDVVSLSADDIAGLSALYGQHQEVTRKVQGPVQQGIDTGLYLSVNPDVAAAGLNPVLHFNNYGWREGRNPNDYFDVNYYLTANPDIKNANINPLDHYLQFGWRENRDPSAGFSTHGYLDTNPDVKLAGINPLLHYLDYGYAEHRVWA